MIFQNWVLWILDEFDIYLIFSMEVYFHCANENIVNTNNDKAIDNVYQVNMSNWTYTRS